MSIFPPFSLYIDIVKCTHAAMLYERIVCSYYAYYYMNSW